MRMTKAVLISTYELGHQPFGLASPAAWLRARGAEVTCFDLSREAFRDAPVREADAIAFYVPMHTATRLATQLVEKVRTLNPRVRLCFYGLYAPVNEAYLRGLGVEKIIGGEFEQALTDWVMGLAEASGRDERFFAALPPRLSAGGMTAGNGCSAGDLTADPAAAEARRTDAATPPNAAISLDRLAFLVPDRAGLPALREYAHLLLPEGGYRVAGYTEASRGCKHLCRHCPIVPVYDGVFRVVPREVVLEDIRRQVALGAEHITFGDPDFFNGPTHALAIVDALHREFPQVSYDVTIKVEHLQRHAEQIERLRDTGCLFVTTAVESVDDAILAHLDKGHTRADFLAVVAHFREIGLAMQPTFVPFTPWSTLGGYRDLLSVIADEGLTENIAPIQLGIRLLIPEGSRLLELDDFRRQLGAFDPAGLSYPWKHADARMDALANRVQDLASAGDQLKRSRTETFAQIWRAAAEAADDGATAAWHPVASRDATLKSGTTNDSVGRVLAQTPKPIPHFTEPWYCCAEPTRDQFVSIGAPATTAQAKEPPRAAPGVTPGVNPGADNVFV
jgi:radical SAM superfamily enzyme YgiQ (UPF0313 family)/outer membrane murein-binding lipoprotein Lpp